MGDKAAVFDELFRLDLWLKEQGFQTGANPDGDLPVVSKWVPEYWYIRGNNTRGKIAVGLSICPLPTNNGYEIRGDVRAFTSFPANLIDAIHDARAEEAWELIDKLYSSKHQPADDDGGDHADDVR